MKIRILSFCALVLPSVTHAATFKDLVAELVGLLRTGLSAIFALIFLYIAYTLVTTWVQHGDDPAQVEKGKNRLIASIIGLVVLASLWGIVGLVQSVLS